MKTLRLIGRSIIDFFRDDGLVLAGSISYFTMMAIVPFCIFLVTLFGYFLGNNPEFHKFILTRLFDLFPDVTQKVTNDISKLISHKGIGKVSIILYGFLSYQLFASLENSLNVIFKVRKKRNFFLSILISLAVITLITSLLLVSFLATSVVPMLGFLKDIFPSIKLGKINAFLLRFILPFVLVLLTVTMTYILLPKAKVRIASAFKGALFTTVLLEVANHMFTWYVGNVVQLGKIYGPLTAFVVFLLWLFYSSCIFLVGAEVVNNAGGSKKT